MKTFRSLAATFFLILAFALSVQAAPPTGTWDTDNVPPDFFAGTWKEILWGGGEGKPGNEITATSEPYYKFKGAILNSVRLIPNRSPLCNGIAEYETTYLGGTLELITGVMPPPNIPPYPKAPWFISPGAAPYVIDLDETIVRTCKFDDDDTFSFHLNSKGIFRNLLYPKYVAQITAVFLRGSPIPGSYLKPGGGSVPSISGNLSSASITITGVVGVDIKPGSCPNPFNVKSRGVLPVAILGGPGFNLDLIDEESIFLTNGKTDERTPSGLVEVKPIRLSVGEDVATPFEHDPFTPKTNRLDCTPLGYDGYKDLNLKFDTEELVRTFGLSDAPDRSTQEWFLMFRLNDAQKTELQGSDVVWILNKTRNGNNGHHYGRIRHRGF
jgi:hypothetical protein